MGLTKRLAPGTQDPWRVSSFIHPPGTSISQKPHQPAIAPWSDSTALLNPGLPYHALLLLKLTRTSFPCSLQSYHLVPQTVVKEKGPGVNTSTHSLSLSPDPLGGLPRDAKQMSSKREKQPGMWSVLSPAPFLLFSYGCQGWWGHRWRGVRQPVSCSNRSKHVSAARVAGPRCSTSQPNISSPTSVAYSGILISSQLLRDNHESTR